MALRLVAAGELIDVDPEAALAHGQEALRLASGVPAVREAVGLAAYHAGQWPTAIAQLRAYHRMSGRLNHLAVIADCERALGRPERAIDIFREADQTKLDPESRAELLIVASGARGDLGQREAAAAMLQVPDLSSTEPWAARLRYAYADALLTLDRTQEAREWFSRAAEIDEEATTDATERLLEIDGVVLDDVAGEEEPDGENPGEDGSVSEMEDEMARDDMDEDLEDTDLDDTGLDDEFDDDDLEDDDLDDDLEDDDLEDDDLEDDDLDDDEEDDEFDDDDDDDDFGDDDFDDDDFDEDDEDDQDDDEEDEAAR